MNTLLSKYKILNQIYRDDRTIVYRAIRIFDQCNVIIKTLSSNIPNLEDINYLKSEYEITKKIDINGIAKVYDLEVTENAFALIKEDHSELTLKEIIAQKKISLKESLKIAIQLSQIIGEIHNLNIVHNDINPSNILINPVNFLVKLTDFSIATYDQIQIATEDSYLRLEGNLDYMSPEQTGRMNRTVDYRTDFYSFGITLYEILTGQLPFQANDPVDKIFLHLTKYPVPPSQINSSIPEAISLIIMKLLAKQAEDRYHSAFGIKVDLENCINQLQINGTVTNFIPGVLDQSSQFIIPQKIYGRSEEINTFKAAFQRVSTNKPEIFMVTGYPGTGKSVLINEIYRLIFKNKCYYAHGEFEESQKNIPYSALINAIQLLIKEILTYPAIEIEKWKHKFLSQLNENAQIIIDLIPEIELIVGPQKEIQNLGLKETKIRFYQVFKNLIYSFTQKEYPLVIFLDNLQWIDIASLELIENLINDINTKYLMFIGSYRDNAVSLDHPLIKSIEKFRELTCILTEIKLDSLDINFVRELVSETLVCDIEISKPLADLIFYKTAGNPFFVNQLLLLFYNQGLIIYNFNTKKWQFSINKIQSEGILDENIIELLIKNIKKLPQQTQKILMFAAFIGNEFSLNQAAIINQKTNLQITTYLWPALQFGLILPVKNISSFNQIVHVSTSDSDYDLDSAQITYKFLHDRVQQAFYDLIPTEQKKRIHLQIGEILLRQISEDKMNDSIFTLVNQLNNGKELILELKFKLLLASLNLRAGKKSKLSSAYEVSQKYLEIAANLLPESSWENHYDLTINIYLELIEIEYLNCSLESAEKHSDILENKSNKILDIIKLYDLKISFYFIQNQPENALKCALYILKKIGIRFSENPNNIDIFLALLKIKFVEKILNKTDLLSLEQMVDPQKIAAMQIMMAVIPAVFVTRPNLFPVIIFKMVEYSIMYGNASVSCFAYACYSTIHSARLENIEIGYHYNTVAQKLVEKIGNTELKAKINVISNSFNRHWKDHLQESILSFPDGIKYGLDSGDIESAGHCAAFYCSYLFLSGENLDSLTDKQNTYIEFLKKYKQNFELIHVKIWNQVTLNLIHEPKTPCELNGSIFNENNDLSYVISSNNNILISVFYLAKINLSIIFKNNIEALEYCSQAKPYINSILGTPYVCFYIFYYCLVILNSYSSSPNKRECLKIVKNYQQKMRFWAKNNPKNYKHKYYLIEAEKSKILGKDKCAMDFYDQAISGAKENKYIQDEALANELAGEFYLSIGKDKIAKVYLTDAYYAYFRWGALAKIKDLESRYPNLFTRNYYDNQLKLGLNTNSSSYNSTMELDLLSIYKSSQAISEEILLNKLLDKLIHILVKHTGAQNAILILLRDQTLVVEAKRSTGDNQTILFQSISVNECDFLPLSIINYIVRTQETLVISNAREDSRFSTDLYINDNNPKSILCMPIVNQGSFIGLIYLENNFIQNAFRSNHLEVLKLLCSQAAISIENAKLYQDLKETKVREKEERELGQLKSRFISIASHEFRTPLTTILGTSELIKYYSQNWPKEKTQTYLDRICDNVKNMVSLLDEVLFLSKGEAGKIDLQSESIVLIEFCQNLVNESQLGAKSGQTIDFLFPDEPINDPITVYLDRSLVQHILRNLLSNAVKYSFPNSVVDFELTLVENKINFKIQDKGIGIPEEDLKKLFGSFHRAANVGSIPGSGLGLSIVKQCVDVHGGTIDVASEVGIGTIFTVSLPLIQ